VLARNIRTNRLLISGGANFSPATCLSRRGDVDPLGG